MRRLLVVPVLITLALSAGCGGSSGPASSESRAGSLASATAAIPQTGVPEIDEVISLTLARDVDGLMSMVGYTKMGCTTAPQLGSPPACPTGAPNGTRVDAFRVSSGCDGWLAPATEAPAAVERVLARPAYDLYSVVRPRQWGLGPGVDYRLIFAYPALPTGERPGFWIDMAGGHVVGIIDVWCADAQFFVEQESEEVISPPPEPRPTATPRTVAGTGVPEVDEVIRLTLARDVDGLMNMVAYRKMGCVRPQQEGSPPECLPGEANGTIVDAFPVLACGGTWERPDRARNWFEGQVKGGGELYAVFRPRTGGGDYYRVLFSSPISPPAPWRHGYYLDITGGRIVALVHVCESVVETLNTRDPAADFLIPPPP